MQGLLFAWSYNQAEAVRSFDAALQIDPQCALVHWARSYGLGPFANRQALQPELTAC